VLSFSGVFPCALTTGYTLLNRPRSLCLWSSVLSALCRLQPDMEARKMRERLAKDAYDSDEEGGGGGFGGGGGGQRMQCAQQ